MSGTTAPKLTYAKIGNKSKQRIEHASTQLQRQSEQPEDLFSQMNQENLNYIKKELKLKKNRSEHDRSRFANQDDPQGLQEQLTQRDKLIHKYNKPEEQVSERDPAQEDTERRTEDRRDHTHEHPHLEREVEEDYADLMEAQQEERRGLAASLGGEKAKALTRIPEPKMYQSLPYEEPKKRVVSIEGYFRESVSTNLQKNREDGNQFIEFLEDYISDLNHSKHLKTRPQDDQERRQRPPSRRDSEKSEERMREELKRLERVKRNSDTFGEPNSKYTVHSLSYETSNAGDAEGQLKRERYHCLVLAQQMEKLHESLLAKDEALKNLRLQNALLQEEITHLKAKQDIILKSKAEPAFDPRPLRQQKQPKHHDENVEGFETANHFVLSHQRHGSVNPSGYRTGYTSRPQEEPSALFKQFQASSRPGGTPRRESRSIERLQQEYTSFMQQSGMNGKRRRGQYK